MLTNLPIYTLSMFRAPKWVLKQIEALRRDFFWFGSEKGHGWGRHVAWKTACRPKVHGGLGVLDLDTLNVALLCKWWWRFFSKPDLLWCILVRGMYYRLRTPLEEGGSFRPYSQWWRDVVGSREIFKGGISYKIGDGNAVRLWTNRWCGEMTLQSLFGKVYNAVERKAIKVSDCVDQGRWRWRKILRGAYGLDADGRELVRALKVLVGNITLGGRPDEVEWRWNKKGIFSVKSTYSVLINRGIRDPVACSIWGLSLPEKVKIFLWLTLLSRLPTVDRLSAKGWSGNTTCVLCGCFAETADHLFLGCVLTRFLFEMGEGVVDIQGMGTSVRNVWEQSPRGRVPPDQNRYRCYLAAHWWVIWRARNRAIFQQTNTDPILALRWVKEHMVLWTGEG